MSELKYIGIDPAFRKNGIGFCLLDGNTVTFYRYSIAELIEAIMKTDGEGYVVAIENSNAQNASFDMRGNTAVVARKARNVGANQATSEIFCQLYDYQKAHVIEISPKDKGGKWLDDDIIKTIAKIEKWKLSKSKLSQDDRDAFKILHMGYKRTARTRKSISQH